MSTTDDDADIERKADAFLDGLDRAAHAAAAAFIAEHRTPELTAAAAEALHSIFVNAFYKGARYIQERELLRLTTERDAERGLPATGEPT